MLKHRLLSGAIVVAGGLFATTALANTDEKSGMHSGQKSKDVSFEKVDGNGDGYISQSEFQDINVEQQVDHSALDQNNDGRLDRTEFAAFEQLTEDQSGQQGAQYPSESTGESYESESTQDPTSSDTDWSSESESDRDY